MCLRIGGQTLAQMLSVYRKNRWRPALRLAAGGAHDAPPDPQVGPPMARACGARTLRFAPSALVPDCGAQIMYTLSPVHTSNNVEATFDIVAKNGNNVERVLR